MPSGVSIIVIYVIHTHMRSIRGCFYNVYRIGRLDDFYAGGTFFTIKKILNVAFKFCLFYLYSKC